MRSPRFILQFALVLSAFSCTKQNTDEYAGLSCPDNGISYSSVIRPIIDANCVSSGCHGVQSSNGNYTTYEGIIARVRNGTFAQRILYKKDMPGDAPLSLDDRRKIKCWIDHGAPKN